MVLLHIAKHMPTEHTQIEIGFFEMIDHAAAAGGLREAERIWAYWQEAHAKETHAALVNQRPDGSIVIEQPDGIRAVYRKVGAE